MINLAYRNMEPKEILTASNLKQTKPRLMVLDQIIGRNSAISQPELEKKLGKDVDRVTLYRTLSTFEEKGILHKIIDQGGTANFAICQSNCSSHNHHDEHLHFNCNQCKKVYCLDTKIPNTSIPSKFTVESMQLLAYGICERCNTSA